ncbi:MAG: Hsp20 family protein [Candidatus Acidiferrales bacterium]
MRIETESKRFLAPEVSTLNPGDAFFELSQEFRDLISRRAYELFELRGSVDGRDREDWLQAVSEILLDVQVDVVETETGLTVLAAVPGFGEKELEVRVAPRSICITGKREEVAEQGDENGVSAERRASQIFRTLELPSEIDPDQVKASLSDGILEIQLVKVGLGKKVPVRAKAATV